jgi:hypothetical protein
LRKKTLTLLIVITILCIAVLFAGCTGTGPARNNAPVSPGAGGKAPDMIVPAVVPGFSLQLKDINNTKIYENEIASAATLFKPDINTTYEGNVDVLTIYVDQFVNSTAAAELYATQNGTSISILGYKAQYQYDPDAGATYVSVNNADLLIQSLALAPDNTTSFDEAVLKDAAIKGMEAALRNF